MIKLFNNQYLKYIFLGILLGTIVFLYCFNLKILNPKNMEWLLNAGDLSQHFLGWIAYLHSDWYFPIGLTDYLIYPNKYSIFYTDSIPLFSFLLKPLYYIIGDFQYIGIYALLSLIMQGIFAVFIIKRWTKDIFVIILFSLMIITSPILFDRLFTHHSLSSHWIILLTFTYILYNYKKPVNIKRDILFSLIMAFIIPGVHFYFFPMVFILLFMYILYMYFYTNKKIILLFTVSYFIVTVSVLYIFGAFYNIENNISFGLGYYNTNLNAFFNSLGQGNVLQHLPRFDGQYEGNAYLGSGFIILLITSMLFFNKNIIVSNSKFFKFLLIIFILFFLLSTAFNITLNDNVILSGEMLYSISPVIFLVLYLILIAILFFMYKKNIKEHKLITAKKILKYISFSIIFLLIISFFYFIFIYKQPMSNIIKDDLFKLFSTFRSTGRFIWVSVYIINFFLIYIILSYKTEKKHIISLYILLLAIIHIYDISYILNLKSNNVNEMLNKKYMTFTKKQCLELKNNFRFAHIPVLDHNKMSGTMYALLKCGIPIDNFYFARQPYEIIEKQNNTIIDDIIFNKFDNSILIVSRPNDPIDAYLTYSYPFNNVLLSSNRPISFLKLNNIDKNNVILPNTIVDSSTSFIYAKGWYGAYKQYSYSSSEESILRIPVLNDKKNIILTLKLRPYLNSVVKDQTITFLVNNKKLYTTDMDRNTADYILYINKQDIIKGNVTITMKLSNPISSPLEDGGQDGRKFGVAFYSLEYVYSN